MFALRMLIVGAVVGVVLAGEAQCPKGHAKDYRYFGDHTLVTGVDEDGCRAKCCETGCKYWSVHHATKECHLLTKWTKFAGRNPGWTSGYQEYCDFVRVFPTAVSNIKNYKGVEVKAGGEATDNGVTLVDIPKEFWGESRMFVPQLPIRAKTKVLVNCCSKECTFYVTVYACPRCARHDGGASASLLADGWTVHNCSPKFSMAPGSAHPTLTFRKSFPPDSFHPFYLPEDAGFLAIFRSTTFTNPAWCPRPVGPFRPSVGQPPSCSANCFSPP